MGVDVREDREDRVGRRDKERGSPYLLHAC
jgi:hypothetical protein